MAKKKSKKKNKSSHKWVIWTAVAAVVLFLPMCEVIDRAGDKYLYPADFWELGFVEAPLDDFLQNDKLVNTPIHWLDMNGYKEGWFADPFLLSVDNDTIVVLCEEMYFKTRFGRISRLTITRKDFKLIAVDPVIAYSETHFSFPYITRNNKGEIRIIPECGYTGQQPVYLYDPITNRCHVERILVQDHLADAAIAEINGKQRLFACNMEHEVITTATLLEYPLPEKNELPSKKPIQTYKFQTYIARNAGTWFSYKGNLYRPAMDNNYKYGGAVIMQKIDVVGDSLTFKDLTRLTSPRKNDIGMHTFNHAACIPTEKGVDSNLAVVDAYYYTHQRLNFIYVHYFHPIYHKIRRFILNEEE